MEAERLSEPHSGCIRDAHLGAGVKFERGSNFPGQPDDPVILDDERIDSGGGKVGDGSGGGVEFVFENERVKSDVAADSALVKRAHHLGKFVEGEADFGAGGKVHEAKVDGVGAGFDGGSQLGPMSRGGHDFGLTGGGLRHCYFQGSARMPAWLFDRSGTVIRRFRASTANLIEEKANFAQDQILTGREYRVPALPGNDSAASRG